MWCVIYLNQSPKTTAPIDANGNKDNFIGSVEDDRDKVPEWSTPDITNSAVEGKLFDYEQMKIKTTFDPLKNFDLKPDKYNDNRSMGESPISDVEMKDKELSSLYKNVKEPLYERLTPSPSNHNKITPIHNQIGATSLFSAFHPMNEGLKIPSYPVVSDGPLDLTPKPAHSSTPLSNGSR